MPEDKESRLNSKASSQLKTKLSWKGSREFRHDLFKLELATMRKNTSYKKFHPALEPVPHVHFFHSHDMKGRENIHCQAVGGHFHEVTSEWGEEPDGTPFIKSTKCGPALRQVQKRTRGGKMKTVIEPVKWAMGDAAIDDSDEDSVTGYETDEHTHKVVYHGSELISPERIRQSQEGDKAKLAAMMAAQPSLVGPATKSNQAANTGGDDNLESTDIGKGVSIRED